MKLFKLLAVVCVVLVASPFPSPARAAETAKATAGPGAVAESFYAGYIAVVEANKEASSFVAASNLVTEAFKKRYAKAMRSMDVDVDPVLVAQYVPEAPFKAGKAVIKGDRATVVLTAAASAGKHQVTVTLVSVAGSWKIDSVR